MNCTYAFDGHSLRTIKVVGAGRTWYLHAGTELIAEFEDAASATYSTPTSPGGAGGDSGALFLYQHGDHLTGRLTTDQQGSVSNEQGHYPYGEAWYATGTADPSVERKFTSYLKDAEVSTGRLNYAVFRQHSARVGRFLRPDPVLGRGLQNLNRYAYVRSNPISRFDPNGLADVSPWGDDYLEMDGGIMPSGATGIGAGNNRPGCTKWPCDSFWNWSPGDSFTINTGQGNPNNYGLVMYPGMGVFVASFGWGTWGLTAPMDRPVPGGHGDWIGPDPVTFGELFPLPQGKCKERLNHTPDGGIQNSMCPNDSIFFREWTCEGDRECCNGKKSTFLDWCWNLNSKFPQWDFFPMQTSWWTNVHCCARWKKPN